MLPFGTCLHVMSMFFRFVYFVLFWDHMKNLDDRLRIPFDVPLVPMLDRGVEARRL